MSARIVLADDHDLVRYGLALLLQSEAGLEVVGQAGDGPQALEAVLRLRPDVLVVDVVLPGINGIEVTREVKRRLPGVRVIVLSMHDSQAYVAEALRAGAAGYVLKKARPDELLCAVRQVLEGGLYLSQDLDTAGLQEYMRRAGAAAGGDPLGELTERERQVFLMAARGLSNPAIAQALALSTRTVETHRANLLRKLGLKNQSELVRFAMQHGLVE